MSKPISIQLWSVRDECDRDLEGTLRQLKDFGYDGVEPFNTSYYGKTVEEFKTLLDTVGLKCTSFHTGLEVYINNGVEKVCSDMIKLGCEVVTFPYILGGYRPDEEHFEDTKKYADQIISIYEKEGIKLLFHNHPGDAGPVTKESTRGMMDILYSETGIQAEADTAWLICGGIKPADFFKKYEGRVPAIHIKDFAYRNKVPKHVCEIVGREYVWDDETPEQFEFRTLGQGIHDCAATVKLAIAAGCEHVIVEQDGATPGMSNLECAQRNAEFLKSFEF